MFKLRPRKPFPASFLVCVYLVSFRVIISNNNNNSSQAFFPSLSYMYHLSHLLKGIITQRSEIGTITGLFQKPTG